MRFTLGVMVMALLGACGPSVFDDYSEFDEERYQRDAALADASQPLSALSPDAEAARIGADAQAALEATSSDGSFQRAGADTPPGGVANPGGISRENEFEVVDAQRSIEQDAARIARNRARYEMVQPEAIGRRPDDVGPNIVAYALATSHPKGTQIHPRRGFSNEARHQRNCAGYASPDLAQIDFLRRGGPERDPQALDPDGDGYACGWDPRPFRRAAGG